MTTEAFLKMREVFNGHVLPVKGKKPDPDMCKRQRGTMKWKDHPNAFANRPATSEEVREWAREGLGIGVILGEGSGVVVFEMDYSTFVRPMLRGLEDELCIPTVQSPSGNHHLYHLWTPGVSGQSFYLPPWNDKNSPLYIGRSHLGSIRGEGQIVVIPPSEGYEWLEGRSIFDCELTPVPDVVTDLFEMGEFIAQKPESITVIGEGTPPEPPTPNPVLENVLVQNDVSPVLIRLIKDKDSPLIPAIVRDLGGQGLKVPCPYHPPDNNPSATLWHGEGWLLIDHHISKSVLLSQLACDRFTGYLDRLAAGDANQHRHLITERRSGKEKALKQSWVWLSILAADYELISLPSPRVPNILEGYSPSGLNVMRFIGLWDRGYRFAFNNDQFPLARRWLISVVFSMPSTDEKSLAWKLAFAEVENTLRHALQQKLLEKVEVGKVGLGGTAALYRLLGGGD